ncbi:MAG: hypothetical protein ACI4ST_04505 [Candidatus Gallimonas sp.]
MADYEVLQGEDYFRLMGIREPKKKLTVSKRKTEEIERCSAVEDTIVFSFRHITTCEEYNFRYFDKRKKNSEVSRAIASFTEKLSEMSKMRWDDMIGKSKKSGVEYLPVSSLDESFLSHLDIKIGKDEKLPVVRFNAQKSRIVFRRGTKCERVVHILGIDYDLKLYKH